MVLSMNYMWIFIEALYLHMLIFVSVFSENSSIRWYIAFGWRKYIYSDCPLLFSWHVHIRYNCLTVYFDANRLRTIVRRTYTYTTFCMYLPKLFYIAVCWYQELWYRGSITTINLGVLYVLSALLIVMMLFCCCPHTQTNACTSLIVSFISPSVLF